ncbi:MAG: sodium:solute symporter, partial [Bacteroidota bacterium]
YKTGVFYFLLSRVIGASFRLYIVINVLQIFVFDEWGIPFAVTVAAFILLILLYTFQGGVKTIVWTDTLQTTFMLLAVVITVYLIGKDMNLSISDMFSTIRYSPHSSVFISDWNDKKFFLKNFFGGAFIAIAMTGLDQEMMQKNISCKTIKESQKNMITFTIILFFINLLFLGLGVLLYNYAASKNIPIPNHTDDLFPTIAIKFLGPVAGLFFIIGLISAAFPSADGALTALTTSFCIDFIGIKERNWSEKRQQGIRYIVHISFAVLLLGVIIYFKHYIDESVLNKLFTVANYTYGPLLGLFTFGLFTKLQVKDRFVPLIALFPPIICYLLNNNLKEFFAPYQFGFEMLIINGALTCIGLFIIAKYKKETIGK